MSSFYLHQHKEWLCLRQLGEESVMSTHRFFEGGGDPPRSGSASSLSNRSSMAWFKPPTAVGELHKNKFMKMFNFFLLDCFRLSVLSQTYQPKRSIFPLCFSLILCSLSLRQPALVSPCWMLSHLWICLQEWGILGWQIFLLSRICWRDFFHWWWLILSCCVWGR